MNESNREVWWKRTAFHLVLIAALVTGLLLRELFKEYRVAGALGFALDDAWIHATMARNLVAGHGFAVNPGENLPVSTSPAWTLLLSVLYGVTRNMVLSGKALGYLCVLGSTFLAYHLVARLSASRLLGLLAATIITVNPITVWSMVSGMEVPLVYLAVLAVLVVHYLFPPDRPLRVWGEAFLLAFAPMVRPELFLLAPVALLDTLLGRRLPNGRRPWKIVAFQCLLYAAFLAPYFTFNMTTIHHLLPTTFYAKTHLRGVGLLSYDWAGIWSHGKALFFSQPTREFCDIALVFLKQSPLLVLLAPFGMVVSCRSMKLSANGRSWLLPLVVILLPLAMGVLTPSRSYVNYFHRYYAPFVPMLAVLACLGIRLLVSRAGMPKVAIASAVLLLVPHFSGLQHAVAVAADDVHNTQALYVEPGRWLHDNLEAGEVIAANDIGGVAYFSGHKVLDVMGLASPEIWPTLANYRHGPERSRALAGYLQTKGIRHFFTSPHYYPTVTRDRRVLEPVKEWSAPRPTNRTLTPQVLYRFVVVSDTVPSGP